MNRLCSVFKIYSQFMEQKSQATLQSLLDKESIRECLYRYCRGIDRADEAWLRSAYWPDAHDCHGAYRGNVEGFFAQALPRLQAGGRGVHQITNILIDLHGARATVESSFFALQTQVSSTTQETWLCGRYLDLFEKREDQWRIADRTVVYDWIEERTRAELAQSNDSLFGKRQPVGGRAPNDPLYAFLQAARSVPGAISAHDDDM